MIRGTLIIKKGTLIIILTFDDNS